MYVKHSHGKKPTIPCGRTTQLLLPLPTPSTPFWVVGLPRVKSSALRYAAMATVMDARPWTTATGGSSVAPSCKQSCSCRVSGDVARGCAHPPHSGKCQCCTGLQKRLPLGLWAAPLSEGTVVPHVFSSCADSFSSDTSVFSTLCGVSWLISKLLSGLTLKTRF